MKIYLRKSRAKMNSMLKRRRKDVISLPHPIPTPPNPHPNPTQITPAHLCKTKHHINMHRNVASQHETVAVASTTTGSKLRCKIPQIKKVHAYRAQTARTTLTTQTTQTTRTTRTTRTTTTIAITITNTITCNHN